MRLTVDGTTHQVDAEPEMPLLWVLRDELGYTGPKYGCGAGLCGACTVHVGEAAVRSCQLPLAAVDAPVTTIHGVVDAHGRVAAAVLDAWIAHQVAQCGYCQPGQIMQAVDLLAQDPAPGDEAIRAAMWGNLCRCATYPRVLAAIRTAAASLAGDGPARG
ncbi:MAG: (2Fe-2S)-binding protein [Pseudomonadota bacterium]